MIRLLSMLCLVLSSLGLQAQILDPVKWTFSTEKTGDDTYDLVFKADIEKGWTVYSQYTSDEGPVPTYIEFESKEGIELVGKSTESGKKKEGFDKVFEVDVIKYLADKPFIIKQSVKVKDASKPISGYLTFMCCDANKCLPPSDVDFAFTIPASKSSAKASQPSGSASTATQPVKTTPAATPIAKVDLPASESNTSTSAPTQEIGSVSLPTQPAAPAAKSKILKPVKWTLTTQKVSDNEFDLIYRADIEEGWTLYSKDSHPEGPIPTTVYYEEQEGIELIGDPVEKGHRKEGKEPMFDNVNVIKFLADEPYTVTHRVKVTDASKPIKGYIESMACTNTKCIKNEDENFAWDLSGAGKRIAYEAAGASDLAATTTSTALAGTNIVNGVLDQKRPSLIQTYEAPLSDCGKEEDKEEDSLLWLLLAGILGGFAALMTPCVFPMIPITVSFFTKDTKRKGWVNGLIYGASIIVIYVILGLLITLLLGPEALNALSTNWIANTIFFIIFLVFAFSFFGFYEITLPSSWTTKSDSMADKGGLIGIFFMAATLALVSFSCTGPIVGSALVAAANGGILGPLIVMFGFSFALALPFGLFAAFPAWLNSLPKSGGWMNSVKVVLGFLEVGFAFKFLSTADLTQHWGLLKYETFMLIMILVCIGIAIYLFGFIKFPHDSPIKKLSTTRKAIGAAFAALAVYLMSGFTINKDTGIYNSLWLTSGFSPPVNYNIFLDKQKVDADLKAQYSSVTKGANNITMFKDYYQGMAYAKATGKPAFVDFTGHGCQNCRRTEDNIWVQDDVRNFLNDSVVLISLYVDDREKLEQPFISATDNKKKRNVGNKWADFQVTNFAQNSQPLYIMITPDERVITHPRPYVDGADAYYDYLECGIQHYRSLQ